MDAMLPKDSVQVTRSNVQEIVISAVEIKVEMSNSINKKFALYAPYSHNSNI